LVFCRLPPHLLPNHSRTHSGSLPYGAPMSLHVAIQMDPVQTINIDADSTFALGLEAQKRGHRLFYYEPGHLSMRDGKVYARGHALSFRREAGNHFTLGALEKIDL